MSESPGQVQELSIPQSGSDPWLLPYAQSDGAWIVSDTLVSGFYDVLDDEGTIETVFGDQIPTAERFLTFLKDSENVPVFIIRDTIVGVAWLNRIVKNHACAHFAHTKAIKGVSIQVGMMVLDYWFSFPGKAGPLFDVLVGNIPASNKLAIRYIKKLGFFEIGEIPHVAPDGAMSISYKVR